MFHFKKCVAISMLIMGVIPSAYGAFDWQQAKDRLSHEKQCFVESMNADLATHVPELPADVKSDLTSIVETIAEKASTLEVTFEQHNSSAVENDVESILDAIDDFDDYLDKIENVYEIGDDADKCLDNLENIAEKAKKSV